MCSRPMFATSLADAQRAIAEKPPALILADLNLADGKAFELLPYAGSQPGLPVLVMTSHGDEQTAVRAMRAGALDYLVKSPEAFAGLPHTVERALREWRLVESPAGRRSRTPERARSASVCSSSRRPMPANS